MSKVSETNEMPYILIDKLELEFFSKMLNLSSYRIPPTTNFTTNQPGTEDDLLQIHLHVQIKRLY